MTLRLFARKHLDWFVEFVLSCFAIMCLYQVKDSYYKTRLKFQWRARQLEQTKRDKETPDRPKKERLSKGSQSTDKTEASQVRMI